MLLALLFADDGALAAAAPACDALPLGARYWQEIHEREIVAAAYEIACVDIDDDLLVQRLLEVDAGDAGERRDAAVAVDAYLFGIPR